MKTLAQLIREHLTCLKESHDSVLTIKWEFETTTQNADGEEVVDYDVKDIDVHYSVWGTYVQAGYGNPAEYPEVEISKIVDRATGWDITELMTTDEMDRITEEVWAHINSDEGDDDNDRYSDRFDY